MKYSSYFKIRTPAVKSTSYTDMEKEVLDCFRDLFLEMKHRDPKLTWLVWKEASNSKPLMNGNNWPLTKSQFLDYVDKCFIKEGYQTWIKCRLGHDIPHDQLKDESLTNWLKTQDLIMFRERIQDKRISKIGFLVGIHSLRLPVVHKMSSIQQSSQKELCLVFKILLRRINIPSWLTVR